MDTDLLCLWCDEPLSRGWAWGHTVECSCGVRYDQALLSSVDMTSDWDAIRRREPRWEVNRDGSDLIITDLDAARAYDR